VVPGERGLFTYTGKLIPFLKVDSREKFQGEGENGKIKKTKKRKG